MKRKKIKRSAEKSQSFCKDTEILLKESGFPIGFQFFFHGDLLLVSPSAVFENIRFSVIQDFPFSSYSDGPAWFPYAAVEEHEALLPGILRHLEIEDHVPVVVVIILPLPGDIPDR